MASASAASRIEGVHPLQVGIFRRKVRTDRRPGMPLVNPVLFYMWRTLDVLKTNWQWFRLVLRYRKIQRRVLADPSRMSYTDESLRPRSPEEKDQLIQVFADKIPIAHGVRKQHYISN